jgi:hypothetical protein
VSRERRNACGGHFFSPKWKKPLPDHGERLVLEIARKWRSRADELCGQGHLLGPVNNLPSTLQFDPMPHILFGLDVSASTTFGLAAF